MAVDTPAKIAVLGAGPMGLEAALYARFLGYDVDIFEQGQIADQVRRWGHVRMFTPFRMNASPLGLAAIAAHDHAYRPPEPEAFLTGSELVERYLQPLAQTDLLVDHLRLQTRVRAIGRETVLKDRPIGGTAREHLRFRLIVESETEEQDVEADVVIDATGTYGQPRWLGAEGIPCVGERAFQSRIEYHLPDIASQSARYAGKHTLVLGSGYSAATAIVDLATLAAEASDTHITWLTRSARESPIITIANDPLVARSELSARANRIAAEDARVQHHSACAVRSLHADDGGAIRVEVCGTDLAPITVDQIVALVGYRPDLQFTSELQYETCYATEGPMKLAASLLAESAHDCLSIPASGPEQLVTTEPQFFVIGSKSYGRNPHFLLAHGLEQIKQIFRILGDRDSLDLYTHIDHLLPDES